jgi:CheY-like chemotaxis protein
MDHMMPDMDGVEAAAAIRAWERQNAGDPPKEIPIIALTANAISGMREMFLENHMNDYLAKPIDVSKLHEILERWIPREKRLDPTLLAETDYGNGPVVIPEKGAEPSAAPPNPPVPAELRIAGLNIEAGIAGTGGTEDIYREVLAVYCRDVRDRFEFLQREPDREGLPLFVTHVHALKGASASIGAGEISAEAAGLEAAGKRGDLAFIREHLDGFYRNLKTLTGHILAGLSGPEQASGKKGPAEGGGPDEGVLLLFKGALEADNIRAIDTLLGRLTESSRDEVSGKILAQISNLVLLSEFRQAADLVDELLKIRRGSKTGEAPPEL